MTKRHHMDDNPNELDAAELFDGLVHIPGVGDNPFPGSLTPGELHRTQAIDEIAEICNENGIPATAGTAVLTIVERVQLLADEVKIARDSEASVQLRLVQLQQAYNALSDEVITDFDEFLDSIMEMAK